MGFVCIKCGKAREGLEQECTHCGSDSWGAEHLRKPDASGSVEFQPQTAVTKRDKPGSMASPQPKRSPSDRIMTFPNITNAAKYRISADEAGLDARIASHDVRLTWDSIQKLTFEQHEAGRLSVGYVRLVAAGGNEIAWTDHKLLLQTDTRYWQKETFQVPASGGGTVPFLSLDVFT